MVYVVNKADNKVLNRIDAWELGAPDKMASWAERNGYTILNAEITLMGDMVIWVE